MTGPVSREQRIRLKNFRTMHPDISIGEEFGAWNATIPLQGGERTLARHSLPELLDDVGEILAGGDPRAHPG